MLTCAFSQCQCAGSRFPTSVLRRMMDLLCAVVHYHTTTMIEIGIYPTLHHARQTAGLRSRQVLSIYVVTSYLSSW
jgi:hypothetical protein